VTLALEATIRDQLILAGRRVNEELTDLWMQEFMDCIADLDCERLVKAFRAARGEKEARGKNSGPITVQMVIGLYQQGAGTVAEEVIPDDTTCAWGCRKGEVEVVDPEGYEVVVPCDCSAGRYLQSARRVFAGKRNVTELRRFGYRVPPPIRAPGFTDEQIAWVNRHGTSYEESDGQQGQPFAAAAWQVVEAIKARGGTWPPKEER